MDTVQQDVSQSQSTSASEQARQHPGHGLTGAVSREGGCEDQRVRGLEPRRAHCVQVVESMRGLGSEGALLSRTYWEKRTG